MKTIIVNLTTDRDNEVRVGTFASEMQLEVFYKATDGIRRAEIKLNVIDGRMYIQGDIKAFDSEVLVYGSPADKLPVK